MSHDKDTTYLPVRLLPKQVADILQNGKPGDVIQLPLDKQMGQRLFVDGLYTHSENDYITWSDGGHADMSSPFLPGRNCLFRGVWLTDVFDNEMVDRLDDFNTNSAYRTGLWASRISLLSFGNRRARIERIWRNHQWDRIELPTDVLSKKCINCGQDFPVSRFQGEWNCPFCDYTFSVETDWTNRPPMSDEARAELRADLAQIAGEAAR